MYLLFLLLLNVWADKYSYPPQKIRADGVERIQISGVRGSIHLTASRGPYRLKVRHSKSRRYDDWSLAVDRQNSTLYLEISSATYGAKWRNSLKREDWPEFDIELAGPPKPVTLSWREGNLQFRDWTAAVESSHIAGNVDISGGDGSYRMEMSQGDVRVRDFKGALNIKGEAGKVSLTGVDGQILLNWLNGPVTINKARGGGRVVATEGRLILKNSRGEWSLQLAKGEASIEACRGKLTAEGDSANWSLRSSRQLEAEVKTLSGAVDLKWESGGAKVFLTSQSGEIGGRKSVRPRLDNEGRKVAEFQIGQAPFAQVFVRTESGPIVFK